MGLSKHHRHSDLAKNKTGDFQQPDPETTNDGIDWHIRLSALALGALLLWMGFNAYYSGNLWFVRHSEKFGWIASPTLDFAVFGFMLLIVGILPWGWIARRLQRKQQRPIDRLM